MKKLTDRVNVGKNILTIPHLMERLIWDIISRTGSRFCRGKSCEDCKAIYKVIQGDWANPAIFCPNIRIEKALRSGNLIEFALTRGSHCPPTAADSCKDCVHRLCYANGEEMCIIEGIYSAFRGRNISDPEKEREIWKALRRIESFL